MDQRLRDKLLGLLLLTTIVLYASAWTGCSPDSLEKQEDQATMLEPSPLVQERREANPYVGTALVCRSVTTQKDIDTLRERGFDLQFRDGRWYIGSELVGEAPTEEDSFVLCSSQHAI